MHSKHWLALALCLLSFSVYLLSPVRQVLDSRYSMLLSQSLLDHRTFRLDPYLPVYREATRRTAPASRQLPANLRQIDGHIFYPYPPGSSVLSVPFVLLFNFFGISAVRPDGRYSLRGEMMIQTVLAAFVTSILVGVLFYTASFILPTQWSALFTLTAAFGTQLFSTASRALWSLTWETLLLGTAILLLLRSEVENRPLRPVLFTTILMWMYFTRPTALIPAALLAGYVSFSRSRNLLPVVATAVSWMVLFAAYSWFHFGTILPAYYHTHRPKLKYFAEGIAGNLISPSRGLLVFCPVFIFVIYLAVRYRKILLLRPMIYLSCAVITVHLIAISGFPFWWGGWSYGPRLTTELVPWFFLLGIISLHSMRQNNIKLSATSKILGIILLFASVLIHANGAIRYETFRWNSDPMPISKQPERLWDWTDPQFLR